VAQAARSLRDLRIAEVSQLDLQIEDGQVTAYRAKVKVSFKFEGVSVPTISSGPIDQDFCRLLCQGLPA
jgi:Dodecin